MPLTPGFSLTQDEDFVIVKIHVPHIRVSAAEVVACDNDFTFYCSPYLLKLTFHFPVDGDDEELCRSTYDPSDDNGTLTAYLPKRTPGQHFPDLDLTSRLLQMRREKDMNDRDIDSLIPSVEVISSTTSSHSEIIDRDLNNIDENETDIVHPSAFSIGSPPSYGFNLKYSNILGVLTSRDIFVGLIELPDPDKIPISERRRLRIAREDELFDAQRYLGDLFGAESDDIFIESMKYKPFWVKMKRVRGKDIIDAEMSGDCGIDEELGWIWAKSDYDNDDGGEVVDEIKMSQVCKSDCQPWNLFFTAEEQKVMSNSLQNREYLIEEGSREYLSVMLCLVDILFAYCYDARLTMEEANVESADNITRLSSAFSWMDGFQLKNQQSNCKKLATSSEYSDGIIAVLCSCCRRSLVYPYIRRWDLTVRVLQDVYRILAQGKRFILKCLLRIRDIFEHTETHYLLNKIFISDYCIWIQSVQSSSIEKFSKAYHEILHSLFVEKEDSPQPAGKQLIGFNLATLEEWAYKEVESGNFDTDIPEHILQFSSEPPQEFSSGSNMSLPSFDFSKLLSASERMSPKSGIAGRSNGPFISDPPLPGSSSTNTSQVNEKLLTSTDNSKTSSDENLDKRKPDTRENRAKFHSTELLHLG